MSNQRDLLANDQQALEIDNVLEAILDLLARETAGALLEELTRKDDRPDDRAPGGFVS